MQTSKKNNGTWENCHPFFNTKNLHVFFSPISSIVCRARLTAQESPTIKTRQRGSSFAGACPTSPPSTRCGCWRNTRRTRWRRCRCRGRCRAAASLRGTRWRTPCRPSPGGTDAGAVRQDSRRTIGTIRVMQCAANNPQWKPMFVV